LISVRKLVCQSDKPLRISQGCLPSPANALDLASGKRAKLGHAAGQVKVQVRIQMLAMELVDGVGMPGWRCASSPDVCESPSRSWTPPGRCRRTDVAATGLLDQELVQKTENLTVDELAANVGMKAADAKWKLLQHGFQLAARLRRCAMWLPLPLVIA
jgi:hypothetical protein